MDLRVIRFLIYFFLAVIAAFAFFIFVNAVGERKAAKAPSGTAFSASALAQSALAGARYNSLRLGTPPPPAAHNFSSGSVRAEGAIMIVKSAGFKGVAEPPKSAMDLLTEMSGGRKIRPVDLKDSDLDKKIGPLGKAPRAQVLSGSSVPGLGKAPAGGGGLIKAPVDYKFFTSSETWSAFTLANKCSPVKADFSKENVVILVSLSDLPSGIFKITALEKGKEETILRYRLDPLAMSVANEEGTQHAYSAAVIPKSAEKITLKQVP